MSDYKLLIDGELVAGEGDSLDVINPANEQVHAAFNVASKAQAEQAVAAAKKAFPGWSSTPLQERQAKLAELVALIHENADDTARLLVAEQGKPLALAEIELQLTEWFGAHYSEQSLPVTTLEDNDEHIIQLHHKPLGVVVGIMPWNFPYVQALYKLAPALLTGNTVVLKPSPYTPLSTLKLGELCQRVFPAGVVNVIADNNELGPLLTAHPDVAKISFTGSTPTGKRIMASSADTLKKLTLELGGNDAGIVLDDADPKKVAEGIFGAAFMNSGQVCAALKRLYVPDSLYDEVCSEIAELAKQAVVGDGMDPATQFGPVQNKNQYEKVLGYIEDARQHGNIIAGGEVPHGPGYFVPLTVVRDIEDGTRVVDEEPFGPILPIIRYHEIDDAVQKANSSAFGLGGSIWATDTKRAEQVGSRLECGNVWVNQHATFAPNVPFATAKDSGIGVEWGEQGLEEFTRLQVVNVAK